MSASGKLIVVTGPSGVGKSTVVAEVRRRTGAGFSISATTRRPRPDERDGAHYRFVDREQFERMIREGELLEWAEVFGNLYGTPDEPVRRAIEAGGKVILEIDVQGGLQVHEKMPEALFVLIEPPSADVLEQRLRGRASESEDSLQRRLDAAQAELAEARASGVYNHRVVNDDLERAVNELVGLIEQAGETQEQ